jgi:hypothetical protein
MRQGKAKAPKSAIAFFHSISKWKIGHTYSSVRWGGPIRAGKISLCNRHRAILHLELCKSLITREEVARAEAISYQGSPGALSRVVNLQHLAKGGADLLLKTQDIDIDTLALCVELAGEIADSMAANKWGYYAAIDDLIRYVKNDMDKPSIGLARAFGLDMNVNYPYATEYRGKVEVSLAGGQKYLYVGAQRVYSSNGEVLIEDPGKWGQLEVKRILRKTACPLCGIPLGWGKTAACKECNKLIRADKRAKKLAILCSRREKLKSNR